GESIHSIRDLRGTAFVRKRVPDDWRVIDSTSIDLVRSAADKVNPYAETTAATCESATGTEPLQPITLLDRVDDEGPEVIRIPSYEEVKSDSALYAHASRVLHKETNPYNARPLVQSHGDREVWLNAPPIPLETEELDWVFELPYTRLPHSRYGDARIPAYEMIRHSVNIMRGCFGGCTFCSITEHEGRIIQNRSEDSIIREVEKIRDTSPAFTGVISDLGGPTANMWRLACNSKEVEAKCRKLSCVFPGICKNLNTDQTPLVHLYRRARNVEGVKKVLIASGLRYDLAVETPEYVEELVAHHVGGYLKIAPEHTEDGPLQKMMKPGMGSYDRFKAMFDRYSKAAGKEQYLIPYFIAAHPGTSDRDMMNLALWLKRNKFRADQVQTFYPSPMATATAMYYSGKNPLKRVTHDSDTMPTVKGLSQRRLHKAFLRYHDPDNWPILRKALKKLGRADLIGNGKLHLVPPRQPGKRHQRVPPDSRSFVTQHNGLPRNSQARAGRKRR
ncbi:MAG: YgiQ family radical SAM protein, partial [Haliea sp.]|nr:YgiQ family radical SAM protein [Haliea sp.]